MGNYRIFRQLGSGGGGTVYLVQHIPTEHFRAAKVLHTEHPGGHFHELDMMKQLRHPALPQILDVLEIESQIWLIMEYIDGKELPAVIREGISADQFFRIAETLTAALIYLHSRSVPILHLDIKPSNVLVRRDGYPVLIDFGASVIANTEGREMEIFGTRGFAAPEQLTGAVAPDVRADIYGLGATLWYCLYGAAPGSTGSSAGRAPGWADGMVPVLKKCLSYHREKRYRDMKRLYRAVCHARRIAGICQHFWGIIASAAFLAAAVFFLTASIAGSSDTEDSIASKNEEEYERLVEAAGGLGFEQAVSCYREAALLQPAGAWGEMLLQRIEQDYVFDISEEEALKNLIYMVIPRTGRTVEEEMQEAAEEYGAFAFHLGLLYWYFYDGTGGRSAASRWFGQAVEAGSLYTGRLEWMEPARIYADISSYYEKIGKTDMEGSQQVEIAVYWQDLKRLWDMGGTEELSFRIRQQIGTELLSLLVMDAYGICQSGEDYETFKGILDSLKEFIWEGIWQDENEREVMKEQYRAAEAAVERVFADERRTAFEKE